MASVHSGVSSAQTPDHTAATSTHTTHPPHCNGESETTPSQQHQQQSPSGPSTTPRVKGTPASRRQAAVGNNSDNNAARQVLDIEGRQTSSVSRDRNVPSCSTATTGNSGEAEKILHVTNLDNQHAETKSDEGKSSCYITTTSAQNNESRGAGNSQVASAVGKALEEEPAVSLSRTSSLLREVHQLAEEDEEAMVAESSVGGEREEGRGHTPDGSSAGQDMDVAELDNGIAVRGNQAGDVEEEPITYHVLENSHIVKLEPLTEHESSVANVEVPEDDEDGGGGSGFDGHTITLVEDEHNAGTFKIAQIGDDNTLRVIDNDRIVVFQDETAVSAVCKEENMGVRMENAKVHGGGGGEEEEYSSVSNAYSNNGDNGNIPGGGYITNSNSSTAFGGTSNNDVIIYEEGRGTQTRLQQRIRGGESSHSYVPYEHGASERVPASVATYAHTSIMRPLHSESVSHAAGHQHHHHHHHHSRAGSSASGSAPGSNNSSSSSSGCQPVKNWHHPTTESEGYSAPANVQTHYAGEGSTSGSSSSYGHSGSGVGSSSCGSGTTSAGVTHHSQQQQQQQTQTYPEYGVSSSSSSATSHGSYGGEMISGGGAGGSGSGGAGGGGGVAYPGYVSQMSAWPTPGQVSAGQMDSAMAYTMTEGGDQKVGVGAGYGHPHATAYAPVPSPYMAATGPPYVGYPAGEINRPWHAAKSTETADLHHSDREAAMYHHQQQQQQQQQHHHHPHLHHHHHQPQQPPPPPPPQQQQHHHGGSYSTTQPSPVVVRPYPTYPGWENSSSQRQLRYMAAATSSTRGRRGSRISKGRLSALSAQTPQSTPAQHSSAMGTRTPMPMPVNPAVIGRPRKRSAVQVDSSAVSKAGFEPQANITLKVEPQRKRLRDHHHHQQQQPQQQQSQNQQQQQQQQQAVPLTNLGTVSSNVHTLKPGHIIAWYIDYLIHENEDRTQISRAFTLPVNLFHTDDFYFLDSLRKKIRFPSTKFLSWMQYHLPSLNAHAIDFREGRPGRESGSQSSVSTWSQDWGWQNKSKRDIIHDVFFYFQHRKASNTDPHQYLGTSTRSKSQLVV